MITFKEYITENYVDENHPAHKEFLTRLDKEARPLLYKSFNKYANKRDEIAAEVSKKHGVKINNLNTFTSDERKSLVK